MYTNLLYTRLHYEHLQHELSTAFNQQQPSDSGSIRPWHVGTVNSLLTDAPNSRLTRFGRHSSMHGSTSLLFVYKQNSQLADSLVSRQRTLQIAPNTVYAYKKRSDLRTVGGALVATPLPHLLELLRSVFDHTQRAIISSATLDYTAQVWLYM